MTWPDLTVRMISIAVLEVDEKMLGLGFGQSRTLTLTLTLYHQRQAPLWEIMNSVISCHLLMRLGRTNSVSAL